MKKVNSYLDILEVIALKHHQLVKLGYWTKVKNIFILCPIFAFKKLQTNQKRT